GEEPPGVYDGPKSKGEVYFQHHGEVSKFRHSAQGQLWVFDGRRAWGASPDPNEAGIVELARPGQEGPEGWMDLLRWQTLTPLLSDKSCNLASLGELWEKRVVLLGIKVSAKGRPNVELYFDKYEGVLSKAVVRGPNFTLLEAYFRDYDGLTAADERLLKNAKRGVADADLIDALRKNIPDDTSRKEIEALVQQLGDKSYAARQKALVALKSQGLKAAGVLNRAAATADLERRRRIEKCLEH